jgi:hypothetical protein
MICDTGAFGDGGCGQRRRAVGSSADMTGEPSSLGDTERNSVNSGTPSSKEGKLLL